MDKWINKIAVVSGASSGIGSAIVRDLASNGIIVIGLARRSEKIDEIAANSSGKIHSYKCDVADLNSIKETFKLIDKKFGKINILINNAGATMYTKTIDGSDETTDRINNLIDTNFKGLVHCTREAIRLMNKSNENCLIVNISSVVDSVLPFPVYAGVYPATKHAVRAFSETVRHELIVNGSELIRISNLSPGVVKTNLGYAGGRSDAAEFYNKVNYLNAEDISQGILYLLSTPVSVNVTQITIKPNGERL